MWEIHRVDTEEIVKSLIERHEIRFHEVDRIGRASIHTISNCMQDTANNHSRALGTSVEDFSDRNMTWVFARMRIQMTRYPVYPGVFHIDTWRSVVYNFWAFREYLILDDNMELIGRASGKLSLIDIEKRRPVKIPSFLREQFIPEKGRAIEDPLERLDENDTYTHEKRFMVRASDLDINDHVNNVSYIDWITESVPGEILMNYSLSDIDIDYRNEARYGDVIMSRCEPHNEDEASFVHALVREKDGRIITLAHTAWKPCLLS